MTTPAHAGWSPPRTFDARHDGGGRLAVNGRGDAVVLWNSRTPARLHITSLPVGGRPVTRVLGLAPRGEMKVVLDERGGATAAWTSGTALYAAHGSVGGRWSAPQRLVATGAWGPALAVARDRTVILAWTNDAVTGRGSTGVAWRIPGTPFTGRTALQRPAPGLMPGEAPQSDNGVAFDALGRAYLWGTCDGVVRVAAPRSRRLALVALAPRRALGFSVSVTGVGRGIASWADSRCTTDPAAGSEPGPLQISLLRAGQFAGPRPLIVPGEPRPLVGVATTAIAVAGDGSLLTVRMPSSSDAVSIGVDAQGAVSSVETVAVGREAVGADAGGNLLARTPYVGVTAHPRIGPPEPFDQGVPPATLGVSVTVATTGTGFGVVWDPDLTFGTDNRATSPARRLSVSLWRPPGELRLLATAGADTP